MLTPFFARARIQGGSHWPTNCSEFSCAGRFACFFSLCWRCIQRHPCEGSFDRDRDRQRQSREKTSWFGVLHTKTWASTQEPSLTALECHSGDNLAAPTSPGRLSSGTRLHQALSSRSPCSLTHDRQVTLGEPLLPPLRQEACI